MHTFYNGLSDLARTIIDSSAGGALMKKTINQAYEILEDTATNTNDECKTHLCFEFISHSTLCILYPYSCNLIKFPLNLVF